MSEYITDTAISVPLYVPGLKADVDLGGLKFSYKYGIFYTPTTVALPFKLPPPRGG